MKQIVIRDANELFKWIRDRIAWDSSFCWQEVGTVYPFAIVYVEFQSPFGRVVRWQAYNTADLKALLVLLEGTAASTPHL